MDAHGSHTPAQEYPHPFIHEVKLSRARRIRGIILGLLLFPLRMVLTPLFFFLMWPLARLRLAGLSEEQCSRPVTGWRRWLYHHVILLLSRSVFFCLGFLWIDIKGRRADLKEAPVLVVAPHSSFLDMFVLCPCQLATVVSRSENTSLPVIGALLEFNQAVMVSRNDPESRRKAVVQLNERLNSDGYWPQMLMFPEGTTTNGRALIKFKPGAFLAGVPVQPVLLRYPNKVDTIRWTYKGTAWYEVLWHTMTQVFTNSSVEFLPVYKPSEEEKKDPGLYADNVQKHMAKALGVPATDYVMEGGVPVSRMGGVSLPLESPARETLSLLHQHGLQSSEVEEALERILERCRSQSHGPKVNADELVPLLGLKDKKTAVDICGFYSKDVSVDVRTLYLSVAAVSGLVSFKSLLHSAFTMFDSDGTGSLSPEQLSDLMGALLGVKQHGTAALHQEALAGGGDSLTEENLLLVLTTHPTYQRLPNEFLQPQEVAAAATASSSSSRLPFTPDGNSVNNNCSGSLLHNGDEFLLRDKKLQ